MNNEESVTKIMIYSNDEEEPVILEGNYNKIIIDEPSECTPDPSVHTIYKFNKEIELSNYVTWSFHKTDTYTLQQIKKYSGVVKDEV